MFQHPAPLPPSPAQTLRPGLKAAPPKPQLKIAKTVNGKILIFDHTVHVTHISFVYYYLETLKGNSPIVFIVFKYTTGLYSIS